MSAIEQQNAPIDEWECPVCYCSREEADGTVRPACRHEVCLPCYSQVRDRDADPTCVLCRRPYWRRPVAAVPAPAPAHDYWAQDQAEEEREAARENYWAARAQESQEARVARWAQERADNDAYLSGLTEAEAAIVLAEREAERRAPASTVTAIRPVVAPSTLADRVARREARRVARKQYRPVLSSLLYVEIGRILQGPIVHETTGEVVPIAALRIQKQRELQARILGLRAATEAQQAASHARAMARYESRGSVAAPSRVASVKTFGPSALPPTRRFRFGDIHLKFTEGGETVRGKCIGHNLWQYVDGTRLRNGLPVVAPAGAAVRMGIMTLVA